MNNNENELENGNNRQEPRKSADSIWTRILWVGLGEAFIKHSPKIRMRSHRFRRRGLHCLAVGCTCKRFPALRSFIKYRGVTLCGY